MSESIFFPLRDLPKYEAIRARATRYPEVEAGAVESFLILMRVGSDVLAAFDKYLARHRMSMGSFTTLMMLNRDPSIGLNPSDLATKCGVTRATMTGLLDGLEREKYVTRVPDTTDRRMATVQLTPEGCKMLDGMLPDFYRRIAGLLGHLDDGEKKMLQSMLWKVNEGIPAVLAT
jgi:DNA-binding MarR family transcriptional regulator